jgi:hypothetical protein
MAGSLSQLNSNHHEGHEDHEEVKKRKTMKENQQEDYHIHDISPF